MMPRYTQRRKPPTREFPKEIFEQFLMQPQVSPQGSFQQLTESLLQPLARPAPEPAPPPAAAPPAPPPAAPPAATTGEGVPPFPEESLTDMPPAPEIPEEYPFGTWQPELWGPMEDVYGQMIETGMPIDIMPQYEAMLPLMQENISRQMAQAKEQYGGAGARWGTGMEQELGQIGRMGAQDISAMLAQLQTGSLEQARGRQMGALGQALPFTGAQAQLPLTYAQAATQTGLQQRGMQQNMLNMIMQEWMRQQGGYLPEALQYASGGQWGQTQPGASTGGSMLQAFMSFLPFLLMGFNQPSTPAATFNPMFNIPGWGY